MRLFLSVSCIVCDKTYNVYIYDMFRLEQRKYTNILDYIKNVYGDPLCEK